MYDRFRNEITFNLKTRIKQYEISTVFLGKFPFDGDKYETMIFCDDENDELDGEMWRYKTKEEAIKGHLEVVDMITKKLGE